MLLPAQGDDGQFRPLHQQIGHPELVAFAERYPFAAHDEVAIVAHPLGLLLADQGGQQLTTLLVAKDASTTNDIGVRTGHLVMVGKGGLDEFLARHWVKSRTTAKPTLLICLAYLEACCLIE